MLLNDYIEEKYELPTKHAMRDMAKRLDISRERMRCLLYEGSHPSRKLAIRIEEATEGDVSRFEAMFPEYFKDLSQEEIL